MELIIAFVVGMIVMDVLWAIKLGIPQMLYHYMMWRIRGKKVVDE